jgi:selenocysteine-specific elongation factor
VLRRPSPVTTLGGGEILDPRWHRRRGRLRGEAIAALTRGREEALRLWVQEAGEAGAETPALARRLGVTPEALEPELEALAERQRLLRVALGRGRAVRWLAPAVVERVAERARRVLGDYFRKERLAEALPKAEAVRRILRDRGDELADVYLQWLSAQKILQVAGEGVTLPGRKAELTGEETRLAARVLALYEKAGLTPPSPQELARELSAKPQIFEGVVGYLVRQGKLARLPGGLLLSATALEGMLAELRSTGWERFTVPQFKERFHLSRKWAIPLLEHLDSQGATRRMGDERQLVR